MLVLKARGRDMLQAEVSYPQYQAWGSLPKGPMYLNAWGCLPAAHLTPQMEELLSKLSKLVGAGTQGVAGVKQTNFTQPMNSHVSCQY